MKKISSRITAIMILVLSIMAIYSSFLGIMNKGLYEELAAAGGLSKALLVGSVAQDMISLPLAIILAAASILFIIKPGLKTFISILGLAWYFFYAYGLYVIQGQYTSIYIIYLGIFSLSIYSMIWGIISFNQDELGKWQLPRILQICMAVFLLMIFFILGPAWIGRMSSDIARHVPGETYGVFILDLGIVFPAMLQIAVMLIRKKAIGFALAGIALLKGFTLCLSWAFAQWYGAAQGVIPYDTAMIVISTSLTVLSLLLFLPYIIKLNKKLV